MSVQTFPTVKPLFALYMLYNPRSMKNYLSAVLWPMPKSALKKDVKTHFKNLKRFLEMGETDRHAWG